jgi:xylulokinase
MAVRAVVGVDIGTSSSKGVLVGLDGRVIRSATREHAVDRPHPGWVEMEGEIWWEEFVDLSRELLAPSDVDVVVAPGLSLPPLRWPGEVAGVITREAALLTGLPTDIPVITGTIDAWAEAISVGAHGVGDLMLMYGTTMFLVNTVPELVTSPSLWGTVGALPDTRNLAAGMATSGAITNWLRELFGSLDYAELIKLADRSGPGANGLLMLPYFAGERTPVMDPEARGMIAGLTLSHTRGDLYRAALEATALGVRHM